MCILCVREMSTYLTAFSLFIFIYLFKIVSPTAKSDFVCEQSFVHEPRRTHSLHFYKAFPKKIKCKIAKYDTETLKTAGLKITHFGLFW